MKNDVTKFFLFLSPSLSKILVALLLVSCIRLFISCLYRFEFVMLLT